MEYAYPSYPKITIVSLTGIVLFSAAAMITLAGIGSGEVNISGEDTTALTGGVTATYSSGGSQGGSGGGGSGGGASGENFTNIVSSEKYYLYIFKDKVTSYRFASSDPVLYVNITGNTSPGEIRTLVEVLRGTSTLVKEPAPGKVYRNANIWVGTSGYAVPKNIKEAVIRFRIENSWMRSNGFSQNEMKMYRWSETGWLELETGEMGKDEKYSYFESGTDSFSSLAISGVKSGKVAAETPNPINAAATTAIPQTAGTEPERSPGFEAAILIIAIFAVYRAGYRKT